MYVDWGFYSITLQKRRASLPRNNAHLPRPGLINFYSIFALSRPATPFYVVRCVYLTPRPRRSVNRRRARSTTPPYGGHGDGSRRKRLVGDDFGHLPFIYIHVSLGGCVLATDRTTLGRKVSSPRIPPSFPRGRTKREEKTNQKRVRERE